MVFLVLFPDAIPLRGIGRLISRRLELHWEVALDDLEPDLARVALNLRGVEFDLTQLVGIVDFEEDRPDEFVGEEVADAVDFAMVLETGRQGELHQGFDRHLGGSTERREDI